MYIATTKKRYKETWHKQVLLRESYREEGKVKTRTLLNLTNKPKEQVDAIVSALKSTKEGNGIILSSTQEQGRTTGLSFTLLCLLKELGIAKQFNKSFEAKTALMLTIARVVLQGSRLQALYWAQESDTILDLLEYTPKQKEKLDKKTVYAGLDYLQQNQEALENKLFKAYYGNTPPKRVFYDVTSSYVEGAYETSDLVRYGYNRDGKKGKAQIVIGLLTDEEGHALSIHTYPGNTNDIATFTDQLDTLRHRFKLEHITVVGDGGMIKSEDIHTLKALGYDYITSIGKASIRKLMDNPSSRMDMTLFDEELKEIVENNTRYILRRNPLRAEEIRQNRADKEVYLKAYIEKRVTYYNTHYRAKKETLIKSIEKKLSSLKLSGYLSCGLSYEEGEITVTNTKGEEECKTKALATAQIVTDEKAKEERSKLDGCYVITTSLLDCTKESKEDIHKAYKTLIKVENAFKTLKTEFLKIRPLYLKSDKRIIGHIALSMIAYNITLKLKTYIDQAGLDFKSTIRQLSSVKTVKNTIGDAISFETIPSVGDNLRRLFEAMGMKFPTKI